MLRGETMALRYVEVVGLIELQYEVEEVRIASRSLGCRI